MWQSDRAVFLLQSDLPGGYGVALLQTLVALAAVSILAWTVLRWAQKRGVLVSGQRVKVLERVTLDARRSLYLVQLGDRVLLLGGGDGAAPAVLAEMSLDELPPPPERAATFGAMLEKLRNKPDAPAREE
ncbi:MAG: FliO/MopB family protein [Sandaracinaceae bacterium]